MKIKKNMKTISSSKLQQVLNTQSQEMKDITINCVNNFLFHTDYTGVAGISMPNYSIYYYLENMGVLEDIKKND